MPLYFIYEDKTLQRNETNALQVYPRPKTQERGNVGHDADSGMDSPML